jgi:hypothetical protein
MAPSNALIVRGQRLPLPQRLLTLGCVATNYIDDGEPHLAEGLRKKTLDSFIVHETGGNTEAGAERTMAQKGYGVHLLLDADGSLSCYADLTLEWCAHAGQANPFSIGLEIVNEYRPEAIAGPHGEIIPARWWTWVPPGARKEYVCPTPIQMAVALAFVPWICDHLGIPVVFPTRDLNAKKTRIFGWQKFPKGVSARPAAGISAHQDFSKHADGRYILEALMRQEGGF